MNLDIRVPIGGLFTLVGVLLASYGSVSDPAVYQRSLGYNVNLIWGAVLFAFGIFMLVLGRRGTGGVPPAGTPPER